MGAQEHGFSPILKIPARLVRQRRLLLKATLPLLIGVGVVALLLPAYGSPLLLQRSLALNNASPGGQATYRLGFTMDSASTLGSIRLQFCANDPIIGTPCTAPNGFDAQNVSLASQSGETGFSISGLSTGNVVILSRVPALSQTNPNEYELSDVINPTAVGSYYVRLETFASDDASGATSNEGGLAFAIANIIRISAEVPPYLTFCTGLVIDGFDCNATHGDYLNFGELSPARTSFGSSQMLVVTNADNGYGLTVTGNTPTSGNNVISALANPDVSRPGTPQFGINLRANASPAAGADTVGPGSGTATAPYNVANNYLFNSGDTVASAGDVEDYRKYTITYVINVPRGQAPGVYVSTVTYIASGSF